MDIFNFLDITFWSGVLASIIAAGICAAITKGFTSFLFYRNAPYSGKWLDEIRDEFGELVKQDEYFLKHNAKTGEISGTIHRILPEAQNYRRCHCTGVVDGDSMILIFWPIRKNNNISKVNGCIYLKLECDNQFSGYYTTQRNGEICFNKIVLKRNSNNDFEIRATKYEKDSRWITDAKINNIAVEMLKKKLSLGDVLDAGAGTGYLSKSLMNSKIPYASLTLVDASANMLKIAKQRLPEANIVCNTIENFSFENKSAFNTIVTRQIYHYVDNVEETIAALKRMIRHNGYIYVGQFVLHNENDDIWLTSLMQRISKSRKRSILSSNLIKQFQEAGFTLIETQFTPYEENLKDFYKRSVDSELTYTELLHKSKEELTDDVITSLKISQASDNLIFYVDFGHYLFKYED